MILGRLAFSTKLWYRMGPPFVFQPKREPSRGTAVKLPGRDYLIRLPARSRSLRDYGPHPAAIVTKKLPVPLKERDHSH
jgi:hypothetical protein